ncbi:hypothetical protein [Microbulbifer thermotolerans]|uniref:hypothetical protein n=1 Tax=Microbulbifer thermotolerans TaxID=252514 RepID=UPI00224B2E11|nr:hypothetical protein [Microbulbifer thermotolerans]MCX2781254.1 hypothetical protein [Microbulbifer thermotolerans]MCX2806665.1 hypothetical protein [Microbulbifer thermotolerans]WKT61908.1 hypothetical protein Q2E61_06845 [Microbulbifer thermotolerans]
MINLKVKAQTAVLFVVFAASSCASDNQQSVSECFQDRSGLNVVRVDERNHRLFVVPTEKDEKRLKIRLENARSCFTGDWAEDWSISLFSAPELAGYQHEEKIIPYHQNDAWVNGYIGEYFGPTGEYTPYPARKQ